VIALADIFVRLIDDVAALAALFVRRRPALSAENLVLRQPDPPA
jgi:hypothetical protein